jgi:phage baseplate assembly protein W
MSQAIALPFSFNASGGVSYTENDKKIWQDRILLAVMTSTGERLMRPSFGTLVNAGSFEVDNDAMSLIKQQIATAFAKWLPDLTLDEVLGSIDPVDGNLSLNIIYKYGVATSTESVVVKTGTFSRTGNLITEVSNG